MLRIPLCTLILTLAVFSMTSIAGEGETNVVRKVSVNEFEKLAQSKTNIVLDVRTKKEFDAGHIAGARNLDVNGPDFEKELGQLDKTKVYLVHCGSGRRSAMACEKMQKAGFKTLIDLPEGFRGWANAGKPVEKSPDSKPAP